MGLSQEAVPLPMTSGSQVSPARFHGGGKDRGTSNKDCGHKVSHAGLLTCGPLIKVAIMFS